ncbi:STAS domain-containing protein [Pseudomonas sp. UBA4194]|uniref:STAS domain-containing protein n=1 Tax=Pseudomonas sp. UBA4194 TaxID=1947317 RepID=UPI0025D44683|nr:STAS domain-containing protein [Pseudomonas sp. UBA4194]
MAVTKAFSAEHKTLTVDISGRFDFASHQDFRNAYEGVAEPKSSAYVINLKDATYMDSSALGMLLLLRDHAGGDNARITLKNANPDVRKILAISNFDKLFTIE